MVLGSDSPSQLTLLLSAPSACAGMDRQTAGLACVVDAARLCPGIVINVLAIAGDLGHWIGTRDMAVGQSF